MPRCHACQEYVTENYIEVFAPFGAEFVSACPSCEHDRRST